MRGPHERLTVRHTRRKREGAEKAAVAADDKAAMERAELAEKAAEAEEQARKNEVRICNACERQPSQHYMHVYTCIPEQTKEAIGQISPHMCVNVTQ